QGDFLYATDFHNGRIDVFDKNFHMTQLAGSFTDTHIPAGFAPLNIPNNGGKLDLTYAHKDAGAHDEVAGLGTRLVDGFHTSSPPLRRLASHGPLNSPWGLVLAPRGFPRFGGDLLVGNFGDGRIHVFNPRNGRFLGTLQSAPGHPLVIDGLWALTFG